MQGESVGASELELGSLGLDSLEASELRNKDVRR